MVSSGSPKSIAALLQDAVQLHQAGRLVEAEQIYDAVLTRDPGHADALNLRGLIALDRGRIQDAVGLLERAVKASSKYAPAHFNLGNALVAAGRTEDALGCYRKAISLDPALAGPHLNAGALLEKLDRIADAVAVFRAMIRACPTDARGYRNLALCLVKSMDAAADDARDRIASEALSAFDRATTLTPADPDLQFEYANLLTLRGEHGKAIVHFEAALKLKPNWVEAISNLGEALRKAERFEEAVAMQRRAIALRPGDQIILTHLGNALMETRAHEEAAEIFRGLMAREPNALLPYINLGNVYRESGQLDDATMIFEEALYRVPDAHEAYTNLGAAIAEQGWFASAHLLHQKALSIKGATPQTRLDLGAVALALGRFGEGWPDYECRFESPKENLHRLATPPPYWRGEDLAGKSILVWTEQGIGDEILYASMIPDIIALGARCLIACSQRMVPIFARSFPECEVIGYRKSALDISGAEQFDYQISIASLGQHLRPDFSSFPRRPGYLKPDAGKVMSLRTRYEALAKGRRIVGISWRSKAPTGHIKSMDLLDLAPLLSVRGIFFVNLQYGDCDADIVAVREQLGVEIFADSDVAPLRDMDAFFAQVAAMDLVITTSNTTAHTAGAQNVPVWILLPFARGLLWYWFIKHQESAWYPSARLIRAPHLQRQHPWWHETISPTAHQLVIWAQSLA